MACSPASSVNRSLPNSLVHCFMSRSSGAIPRLNDTILGPQNGLPSPATDVAYILSGDSQMPNPERSFTFEFVSHFQISQVTIHYYYCTDSPPQLQLSNDLAVETLFMTPACGDMTHRQSLSFNLNNTWSSMAIFLDVRPNGGRLYLTEVQFFSEVPEVTSKSYHSDIVTLRIHCLFFLAASSVSPVPTPTPSGGLEVTLASTSISAPRLSTVQISSSTVAATSVLMDCAPQSSMGSSSVTTIARSTPILNSMLNQCSDLSNGVAIAGWITAGVSVLINGVLACILFVYCCQNRRSGVRKRSDLPTDNIYFNPNLTVRAENDSDTALSEPHYAEIPVQLK